MIVLLIILIVSVFPPAGLGAEADSDAPQITLIAGPVNGAFIEKNDRVLVVYGDPTGQLKKADQVLFTHHRRDVVWAGRRLVENGARSVVPLTEASLFSDIDRFWSQMREARYHDYGQQGTRVLTRSLRVDRSVREGDEIIWQGLRLRVVDTPGYTRGAISYLLSLNDVTYAFVGDLIYGDGQLLDLTSLQDEVQEAGIRGYHGYAGRMGALIQSLRKIRGLQPDILIPARGPVIRDPQAAIDRLIKRLQAVYENYLSISAGRWYFTKQYDKLAARVLDEADGVPWMSYASTLQDRPPDWIIPIGNSRLLLADNNHGFLVDCGSQRIVDRVKELRDEGRLQQLDGLFITHYHDDHTDFIDTLLRDFPCPVYVTEILEDVLTRPQAHRLPAMTHKPVHELTVVPDGYRWDWEESVLRFYDFPGQTLYHDALLVERKGRETVFFIGDSFTPSGIDDYCLQNRCLLQRDMGYFYCLNVLDTLPKDCLLINEHVLQPFAFDAGQIQHMRQVLKRRVDLLSDLFPWDDANFGIDEQWVRIYPYEQMVKPGNPTDIQVRIMNHSPVPHEFTVTLNTPEGVRVRPERATVRIPPRQERVLRFSLALPVLFSPSGDVVTADIQFDSWDLRHWCEGLLTVAP